MASQHPKAAKILLSSWRLEVNRWDYPWITFRQSRWSLWVCLFATQAFRKTPQLSLSHSHTLLCVGIVKQDTRKPEQWPALRAAKENTLFWGRFQAEARWLTALQLTDTWQCHAKSWWQWLSLAAHFTICNLWWLVSILRSSKVFRNSCFSHFLWL